MNSSTNNCHISYKIVSINDCIKIMNSLKTTNRIGYIDSMRGFAMILVIYWHVIWSLFNSNITAIDTFFFRLECLF